MSGVSSLTTNVIEEPYIPQTEKKQHQFYNPNKNKEFNIHTPQPVSKKLYN